MSLSRMNNNHMIFKQCPSSSYLYVVDEEEKIQKITNSLYNIQRQKSSNNYNNTSEN